MIVIIFKSHWFKEDFQNIIGNKPGQMMHLSKTLRQNDWNSHKFFFTKKKKRELPKAWVITHFKSYNQDVE